LSARAAADLHLGLISGTSMDAIDAALVDFTVAPLRVIATAATPFDPILKARIARLIESADSVALDEIGEVDVEVARGFARVSLALLETAGVGRERVAAIGSHGQTLRHRPQGPTPFTWQIGDPNVLAEMTGITVVADFRRRDVAAGGQGAPLLPVFHDQVFRSDEEDRVIANLGGIANITVLRRGAIVTGFDTGPANRLLDAWISHTLGSDFDAEGAWAATGEVDATLLERLLDEPYLRLAPPKSTGRELFNLAWLRHKLGQIEREPENVQATLQQFTVETVAAAVRRHAPGAALYVCGGGARNQGLLDALAASLAPHRVATTAALGLDPDFVEAIAFAWFAKRTLSGLTASAASVTGARGARILGGLYPAA
jgi:anhydro-N-acetylmuramic acid kinase